MNGWSLRFQQGSKLNTEQILIGNCSSLIVPFLLEPWRINALGGALGKIDWEKASCLERYLPSLDSSFCADTAHQLSWWVSAPHRAEMPRWHTTPYLMAWKTPELNLLNFPLLWQGSLLKRHITLLWLY